MIKLLPYLLYLLLIAMHEVIWRELTAFYFVVGALDQFFEDRQIDVRKPSHIQAGLAHLVLSKTG